MYHIGFMYFINPDKIKIEINIPFLNKLMLFGVKQDENKFNLFYENIKVGYLVSKVSKTDSEKEILYYYGNFFSPGLILNNSNSNKPYFNFMVFKNKNNTENNKYKSDWLVKVNKVNFDLDLLDAMGAKG